jgi:Tfp pilus assembly protein FimT
MLLDISVTVQNKTTAYDAEGVAIEAWTASQTVERSNKQPLSGEIAFKDYGISDAGITNLFFLKTSTTAIEGGRIVYGAEAYDIYRIEKYGNHYEAIVRPVVS